MSDIVNGKPAASRPFYQLRERMHSEVLLIFPAGAGCPWAAGAGAGRPRIIAAIAAAGGCAPVRGRWRFNGLWTCPGGNSGSGRAHAGTKAADRQRGELKWRVSPHDG